MKRRVLKTISRPDNAGISCEKPLNRLKVITLDSQE
jgi:hypothetical protein